MKESAQKGRERRKYPRRFAKVPIHLTFGDGTSKKSVLTDLSVTGSRIYVSPEFHPILLKGIKDSKAKLSICLPDSSIDSELTGEIAWVEGDQVGIRFDQDLKKLKPELISFILEKVDDIDAFTFEVTVYLKDTNAFGNTYFARYFDWQGMAREAFMKYAVEDPMAIMKAGIKLITVNASIDYYHETTLYDNIVIKVHGENIKTATFDLVFNFYDKNTTRLIASGRQRIAFAGLSGKLIPVPEQILNPLLKYSNERNNDMPKG